MFKNKEFEIIFIMKDDETICVRASKNIVDMVYKLHKDLDELKGDIILDFNGKKVDLRKVDYFRWYLRYWVIRQPERIYHVDKDDADYYVFIDEYDRDELTLEDLKDKLENLGDDNLKSVKVKDGVLTFEYFEEWFEKLKKFEINYDNYDIYDREGRDKILELLEFDVSIIYYKEIDVTVDNCMFLTQIDAENHLRANDYHYHEKARTYCMCGWRNPRFERLIKILSKTDFDSMLEKN